MGRAAADHSPARNSSRRSGRTGPHPTIASLTDGDPAISATRSSEVGGAPQAIPPMSLGPFPAHANVGN